MAGSRIVVVGGSLGGLRMAEQLRAAGHEGALVVIGAEPHPAYSRPPLSKDVLADPELADAGAMAGFLAFRRRASVADVDFRFATTATGIDFDSGQVSTDGPDGPAHESFDGLAVATGLRPRRLQVPGPQPGRHVLRTVEDCVGLRSELAPGSSVVVVGAGFIGCEVACTLTAMGHSVTVVEPTGAPLNRVLGADFAAAIQAHHEAGGISFRIGPGLVGYRGEDRVTGVELSDGEVLPADVVVEAVGSQCNTEWLAGSPLDRSDGVLTDEHLRAVRAPAPVVVVGDIARFPNPLFDDVPRRVEHWALPTDCAKHAAPTLLAALDGRNPDLAPFAPIPSFWSDQAGLRFQSFGSPGLGPEVHIEEGDLDDLDGGLLTTHHREGRHVGTVAVNLTPARQRGLRDAFVAPTEKRI